MTTREGALLRDLTPAVLSVLMARGVDLATAEDAVQEALLAAVQHWADEPPRDAKAWLVTTAWRKFLDIARADSARRGREERLADEPAGGEVSSVDDELQLYFLCAHPSLTPASAVALTLRALGGLTTAQIAEAFLVPESTMAQRISRAKRTVSEVRFTDVGELSTVLTTLYLVFNQGYSAGPGSHASGSERPDLAVEAIRLTRQLAAVVADPEVIGLLALMLLHHSRRDTRYDGRRIVPLAEQDRSRWDTTLITEGIDLLQSALARDGQGPYQIQAAIAALHADAPTARETDWVQIVQWYDELVACGENPVVRLNRAVAVGEADGGRAGLVALAEVDRSVPRWTATSAYLHEKAGDRVRAAALYAEAAALAGSVAEREHLTRQAARLNHG